MSSTGPAAFTPQQAAYNEAVLGDLTELIRSGEAIVLIGAGSSISAGYDSWNGLLSKLADEALRCDSSFAFDPNPASPLVYAQRIRDIITHHRGMEHFENYLARQFSRLPVITRFHEQLACLPFRAYLTTNYEFTIEEALVRSGRVPERPAGVAAWKGKVPLLRQAVRAMALGGPIQFVIHLHGLYDEPASVILCADDYEAAYGFRDGSEATPVGPTGPTRLWVLLASLLTTRRLVFIGFSLTDPYFLEMLNRISGMMWEWGEAIHYAILPIEAARAPELRLEAAKLKDRMGIETVFYDATADPRHSQRDVLIDQISRNLHPVRAAVPPPRPGTAVAGQMPAWVNAINAAAEERVVNRED